MQPEKQTILIAEDDNLLRASTAEFLHNNGYHTLEAESGTTAIALLTETCPDLIITDLQMPDVNGLKVLQAAREQCPNSPVIIFSGVGTMEDVVTALRLGAWDYLPKPLSSFDVLLLSVEKGLEHKALQLRIRQHTQHLEQAVRDRTAALETELEAKKIVEQHMKQARWEWERTVDAMPEYIALVDTHHKMIRVNRPMAAAMGISPEEAVGKECFFCVHGLEEPPDYCPHRQLLQDGQFHTTEVYEKRLGGWFNISVAPYRDPDSGDLLGSVHIARDITRQREADMEKEKLQIQLLHAQKLESVGRLAAGIAHEVNTPTQYVGTNVDFLEESCRDIFELMTIYQEMIEAAETGNIPEELTSRAKEALEEADWEFLQEEVPTAIAQSKEGINRVTTIVRAMKEFAHPGNREKELVNLNSIIETTITVARNEWKYVADVATELDEKLPMVPCLSNDIGQVILNILVNAAHAIEEQLGENMAGQKGAITIGTDFDEDWVEMRISDTGSGIPKAIRKRIYDPFFTTKEVGKGTGQGLAISHDVIVNKHGGTIAMDSEPGKGTSFTIRLPRN